jgi:predicted RNA binding protein YcfA (HicA-like mRNA interferase family)
LIQVSALLESQMKVRDVIKRLEQDGWHLARTKGSHRQYHHPSSREPLLSQDIRHWTFRREH